VVDPRCFPLKIKIRISQFFLLDVGFVVVAMCKEVSSMYFRAYTIKQLLDPFRELLDPFLSEPFFLFSSLVWDSGGVVSSPATFSL